MRSQSPTSLRSFRGLSATLALAATLLGVASTRGASAPPETSRQAIETALAKARKRLPTTAPAYSEALGAMIRQDPKRGAELIREALRFPQKGRWTEANAGYYLVESPYYVLLEQKFELAVALAMDHPDRLFGALGGAYHNLVHRDLAAAVKWAPVLIKRQPAHATPIIAAAVSSQLYPLSYLNQKSGDAQSQAQAALQRLEQLTPLLPPGPDRARVKMQAGFYAFNADRPRAVKWLEEAVDENPGGRAELDEGLWRQGQSYVQQPQDGFSVEGWRKLAQQYRLLGSEAGVAGVVRQVAASSPATVLKLAPEVRDPSMRALALSELLETRGYQERDETSSRREAAAQIAALLPAIKRPVLRAFIAYRLAYWQRETAPASAAANFRLAYDLMRSHQRGPQGIFGAQLGFMDSPAVRGMLLGHLSHYRPDEAMRLGLSERKALGEHFPTVVFHAAAHAESGRVAERWLRDYLPQENREENRRAYGVCVTKEHPERAAALVPTMPASHTRDIFLIVVVERLAARDPDAALRLSRYFSSDRARSYAYLSAIHAVSDRGVASMLKMAGAIPLPLLRADGMALVINAILEKQATEAQLAEARRVAELMPDEGPKWQSMEQIATAMGAYDVDAAMRYALGIDRYTERLNAERSILASLVPKQMERALSMAAEDPSEEGRVDLIAGIADDLAKADPEAAVALAMKIEHRPTREQVLASAILQLQEKKLDRALELAPEVVTRSAARRIVPSLWLKALKAKKSPAQVWPLYRSLSEDVYSLSGVLFEEHRRNHPNDDNAYRLNLEQIAVDRTVQWLAGFPREEWLKALQAYVAGDARGRIARHFAARLVVKMAATSPEDALALAAAADLEESGWSWLASTLSKSHPEYAKQAAERVREPHLRISTWLSLLEAARARNASTEPLQQAITAETGALAATVRKDKSAAGRAYGYLSLASYLQRGRLDPKAYLGLARTEASKIPEPLVRAQVLRSLETFPR